jgi:hypothetical protein
MPSDSHLALTPNLLGLLHTAAVHAIYFMSRHPEEEHVCLGSASPRHFSCPDHGGGLFHSTSAGLRRLGDFSGTTRT